MSVSRRANQRPSECLAESQEIFRHRNAEQQLLQIGGEAVFKFGQMNKAEDDALWKARPRMEDKLRVEYAFRNQ